MAKIIHWNCHSIKSKRSWLKNQFFTNSSIILLQETFLKPIDNLPITEKIIYRKDRTHGRGGGLLTAIDRNLPSHPINLKFRNPGPIECQAHKVMHKNHSLTVVNIYIPPNTPPVDFLSSLLTQIDRPFLIAGDFNVHHPALGSKSTSIQANEFIDWILNNNLGLLNTSTPTHYGILGSPALLDLNLISSDMMAYSSAFVHPDPFESDHSPTCITIQIPGWTTLHSTMRSQINWTKTAHLANSMIETANILTPNQFIETCQASILTNKTTVKVTNRTNPPWWTHRCSRLLGKKRKIWREAKRSSDISLWIQYKKISFNLRKEIKNLSRTYWDNVCKNKGGSADIFKILRALRNKPTTDQHFLLRSNGDLISDSLSQANKFAQFYTKPPVKKYIPIDCSSTTILPFNLPFSIPELNEAIRKTKTSTPGPDQVSARLFKGLSHNSVEILLNTINQYWQNSLIPQDWILSTIVPILKPGKDSSLTDSYRPISLTQVICKITERMLVKRLIEHTTKTNYFHPLHFGFLPNRGVDRALSTLHHKIVRARKNGNFIVCTALDIKAAYDSVWPDGLLFKLAQAQILGSANLWIANLIRERNFRVRWRGTLSALSTLHRGVPQGSVLAPFLFMVYVSDLFEVLPTGVECLIYADDIWIICEASSMERILHLLQRALTKTKEWCNEWELQLDPDKCKAINFSAKRQQPRFDLSLDNQPIPWVTHLKILGLYFSKNLTFSHHFAQKKTSTLKKINALKAIAGKRWGARSHHLIQIVESYIRPTIDYGCQIFITASKSQRKVLEVLYNNALRIATGLPGWTPLPLIYKEANSQRAADRHLMLALRFFIKSISRPISPTSTVWMSYLPENRCQPPTLTTIGINWLKEKGINLQHILKSPSPLPTLASNVFFHSADLPFQDKSLPENIIRSLFESFCNSLEPMPSFIYTDASKQEDHVGIGIINSSKGITISGSGNSLNSIFTAEGAAIYLAVKHLCTLKQRYFLFTDSLSCVKALEKVNNRSPTIIHNIVSIIYQNSPKFISLDIVWIPAHIGIPENEKVDSLAKASVLSTPVWKKFSPEDLCSWISHVFDQKALADWETSKYHENFKHMDSSSKQKQSQHDRSPSTSREDDVILARIRTRSVPTNSKLYRFHLTPSPNCSCGDEETIDHIILSCPTYEHQRQALRKAYGIGPLSFSCLLETTEDAERKNRTKAFLQFVKATGRF